MKRIFKYLWISLCLIFCSGCWDQYLMKDVSLVTVLGFDLTEEGKSIATVTIPRIPTSIVGIGRPTVQTASAEGNSPRECRLKIDSEISGKSDRAKLRVLILGESTAKQDIYPNMDVIYRDSRSALDARLIIVKGKAKEFIQRVHVKDETLSEYLSRELKNAEDNNILPIETIHTIRSKLFDSGQDFMIPYVKADSGGKRAKVEGLAMFHNQAYAGKSLNIEQSILYLLMANEKKKSAYFTERISNSFEQKIKNFITVSVTKANRNLVIIEKRNHLIHVHLNLDLYVEVVENVEDRLHSKEHVKKLNKSLSTNLTQKAKFITQKMQEANCDGFGIGRRLMALHPRTWDKLNWKEDYKKVVFIPKVKVKIINHGITN